MLYHGPVRVPSDAVVGSASLTLKLSDDSKFASAETEIKVELVAGKKTEDE